MTDFPTLSAELTKSLTSLWTRYAGKRPTNGRTEIRGNVVTCVLVDAVGDFNKSMIAPAAYKREAVAAVVRVTRQRVASFVSRPRPRHGRRHRGVHSGAIPWPRNATR